MTKFKGFELVRVLRAVTATSPKVDTDLTHQYEVEIHGMTGKYVDKAYMSIVELRSAYSKELGMTKHQFGILECGGVSTLSQAEYEAKVIEWNNR